MRRLGWLTTATVILAVGCVVVPAHTTSLWGDWDFSGWVAPIANRMADGQRLYVDGGHSPMAPLSYVSLALLFGHHNLWITESLAQYLLQVASLLLICATLSRYLPRAVAILAVVAAAPLFLSLPKVVLYDSMAQFWAAVGVVAIARLAASEWADMRFVLLCPLAAALCFLTKQSTGTGLIVGTCAAIALLMDGGVLARFRALLFYGLAAVVFGAVIVLLCAPWASPAGFVHDVLLHGSEPKGGTPRMLANLALYGQQIVGSVVMPAHVTDVGLALGFVLTGFAFVRRRHVPLAAMFVAALGVAIFHALSVGAFRWIPDNNPLVPVSLALVFGAAWELARRAGRARWPIFSAATIGVFGWIWVASPVAGQVRVVMAATEPWPEVPFLAGAKLQPSAEGLRAVVAHVRAITGPDDAVLLMPGDPNVEAWIDRPRPKLSSAIIFTDQYWDEYVEADMAVIRREPPKVIIVGPSSWRWFSSQWMQDWGAARFGDAVIRFAERRGYAKERMPITYQFRADWLDVYVRP